MRLLASLDDGDPPVTRTLEVPTSLDLERLHRLLQRAFGWHDHHLYRFARRSGNQDGDLYLCDADV